MAPGLQSIIKVTSSREIKGQITTEERYYLSSLPSSSSNTIANAIRSHWGIENSVHYVLDVTFGQDRSRIRKENAPENVAVLRHMALNLLKAAPNAGKSNPSNNLKRKKASMDREYLKKIILGLNQLKN